MSVTKKKNVFGCKKIKGILRKFLESATHVNNIKFQ